jgi:hypothetical protein
MENINISIPASDIEDIIESHISKNERAYAESLAEVISKNPELLDFTDSMLEAIDYDVLSNKVLEEMDYDDLSSKVIEKMDGSELAEKVQENLDYYDLGRALREYMDIPDEIEIDQEAKSLLQSYNPGNSCSLGDEFTQALSRGFLYLLERDLDFKVSVVRGLRDPEHLMNYLVKEADNVEVDSLSNLKVTDASNSVSVDTLVPNSVENGTINISLDDFNKIVVNAAKMVTTDEGYRVLNIQWLTNQVLENLGRVHDDKFNFGKEV